MFAWYQSPIQLRKQWQHQGWLDRRWLQVQCDPELYLFSFRYRSPEAATPFVVARLLPPNEAIDDLTVQIDGKVLLDSFESENGRRENTITLNGNRAIIGLGEWTCG